MKNRLVVTAALTFLAVLTGLTVGAGEDSEARAAWERLLSERQRDNPAFAFVEDDPALPRVLLIGDSISIGYTADVRALLAGEANVHRIPTNAGDTNRGVASIDAWLGDGKWDVIHFNWGLHDIKRVKDGKLDASMERALTPAAYEANLRKLVQRLHQTGARLVWCSTTPVPEGAEGRIPGDEAAYNQIAAGIMKERNIPVNNLYGYVKPDLGTHQRPANVHFHPGGSAHLAKAVAEAIRQALQQGGPDTR